MLEHILNRGNGHAVFQEDQHLAFGVIDTGTGRIDAGQLFGFLHTEKDIVSIGGFSIILGSFFGSAAITGIVLHVGFGGIGAFPLLGRRRIVRSGRIRRFLLFGCRFQSGILPLSRRFRIADGDFRLECARNASVGIAHLKEADAVFPIPTEAHGFHVIEDRRMEVV